MLSKGYDLSLFIVIVIFSFIVFCFVYFYVKFWTHICPFLILTGQSLEKIWDVFNCSDLNTPKIPHLPVEPFMVPVPFCDQSAYTCPYNIICKKHVHYFIFYLTYLYSNLVHTMPMIRMCVNISKSIFWTNRSR